MKISVFTRLLILGSAFALVSISARAAIPCRPGMGNCPSEESPSQPGRARPLPSEPKQTVGLGYFEVASPSCTNADLALALEGAKERAYDDAASVLRVSRVYRTGDFRVYTQKCEQSIYAGSFRGNSWIVQIAANYQR